MTTTVTDDPGLVEQALALRERVFCGEQGVALEAERDGHDDEAIHVVCLRTGRVLGTCRVLVRDGVARLGRMAVEPLARGRGIGGEVLAEAERAARVAGATRMRLHAQSAAIGLYERAGYEQVGDPFVEEGIDHVTMERALA
ncbi:MAG TPA: GNAT family N-acetyltransferase [Thermoleophilaceae bacterium]|jgi:predicted GNAT family N-acyltransferase